LIFLPFAFVYRPQLLLLGTPWEIAYSTAISLTGFMAFAMALQKSDFLHPRIPRMKAVLFGVAGLLILFPSKMWVDGIGFALLAGGWIHSLLLYRRASSKSRVDS
jgi:TRAP-type uncharacterized transport system fused permease subunit